MATQETKLRHSTGGDRRLCDDTALTGGRGRKKRRAEPGGRRSQWYVIHTYSGYENKVKTNLEHRIETMDAQDLIFQVVIPTEDEIEIRDGQRRTVSQEDLPRLRAGADDRAQGRRRGLEQGLVRRAQHARRHRLRRLGHATRAAGRREVKQILRQMRVEEPRVKVGFQVGQSVRIVDGPFVDFVGQVDDINLEKGKVKVLVSFFGRETPVELDFLQVERL